MFSDLSTAVHLQHLSSLVTPLPINLIHQSVSTPLSPDVLPQQLKRAIRIHIRRTANVRRDQHIRGRPKWVIRRKRFRIRNIERCAADELLVKGLYEGGLIDDLAAGNVGDESAARVRLVEERELVGREEVCCC